MDLRAIRLAFAGFALMLAVACQGCGGWSGPRLTAGNPNPSMGGFPAVSPAHHALLGEMLWEIDYRVGGHAASLTFPLGAVLCSTSNMHDGPCKHVWQKYAVHW